MKLTILSIAVFFLQNLNNLNAQDLFRFDETWWIGSSGKDMPDFLVNYGDDEPIIETRDDPMVNEFFTTSSICSGATGRLLFNTNGCWIADSTSNMMENGDSICLSNFMFSFKYYPDRIPIGKGIVPMEFGDGQNFALAGIISELVDNDTKIIVKYLYLNRIKFSKQYPNGRVIKKAIKLMDSDLCLTGMSACRHANGRDWWLVLQSNDDRTKFTKFMIGPDFAKGPFVQHFDVPESLYCAGTSTFTPDGTKWLHSEWQFGTQIFDFDRATGQLSNFRYLDHPFPQIAGDIIVSPNSRFLYLLDGGALRQFDISLPDIISIKSSEDTVALRDTGFICPIYPANFGGACLAPNGKIYINTTSSSCAWSVINKPNEKGKSCNAVVHQLIVPSYNGGLLIPNHPNYRLGPIDGSPADSLGIDKFPIARFRMDVDSSLIYKVNFTDLSFFNPETWSWDFGDGQMSADTNPVHTFPGKGSYHVCLTVQNQHGSNTLCRDILLGNTTGTDLTTHYGITINPNPCRNYLLINAKNAENIPIKITIKDLIGMTVKQEQIDLSNGFATIDVSSLHSGFYSMTFENNRNERGVVKFVKE